MTLRNKITLGLLVMWRQLATGLTEKQQMILSQRVISQNPASDMVHPTVYNNFPLWQLADYFCVYYIITDDKDFFVRGGFRARLYVTHYLMTRSHVHARVAWVKRSCFQWG